jgi:hypothetical protein
LLLNSIIFPLILKFSDFFSPLKSKRFQIPWFSRNKFWPISLISRSCVIYK